MHLEFWESNLNWWRYKQFRSDSHVDIFWACISDWVFHRTEAWYHHDVIGAWLRCHYYITMMSYMLQQHIKVPLILLNLLNLPWNLSLLLSKIISSLCSTLVSLWGLLHLRQVSASPKSLILFKRCSLTKRISREDVTLNCRDKRAIFMQIQLGRAENAVEIAQNLNSTLSSPISVKTIRNALKKDDFVAVVKKKKPFLSKHHRRQCLAFALRYQHWTVEEEGPATLR